jgi:protein-tyrosine phosphatase
MNRLRVLFVCTGNICRSPTAEGVFRSQAESAGLAHLVHADSAGTTDYHTGEPPDPRTQAAALRRKYDLRHLRARQVSVRDFAEFDYLMAMGADHLDWLRRRSPRDHLHKIRLFLDCAPELAQREVPDPFYGGSEGFELVLDLIERASSGLLEELRPELERNAAVDNARSRR